MSFRQAESLRNLYPCRGTLPACSLRGHSPQRTTLCSSLCSHCELRLLVLPTPSAGLPLQAARRAHRIRMCYERQTALPGFHRSYPPYRLLSLVRCLLQPTVAVIQERPDTVRESLGSQRHKPHHPLRHHRKHELRVLAPARVIDESQQLLLLHPSDCA